MSEATLPPAPPTTKTGQKPVGPFKSLPTMIPQFVDGQFTGKPYKIELVLLRGNGKGKNGGGARKHVWLFPDPRLHNHPWKEIFCKAVYGWYTAKECVRNDQGGYTEREITLSAGDPEHIVPHDVFHQVIRVMPGTITIMTFNELVDGPGNWGNLMKDDDEGWYIDQNTNQPGFLDAIWHLNPHMRPVAKEGEAPWVDPYAEMPVPDLAELLASVGL